MFVRSGMRYKYSKDEGQIFQPGYSNMIHFVAALSNVLRAQFEFMQKKYDFRAKEKFCSQISTFYFFLSKLDQIRQEETSYY